MDEAALDGALQLLFGNVNLTLVDLVDDVVCRLSVDSASDRLAGSQDLLDRAAELLCQRLVPHSAGNLDDLIHGDVSVVLTVLLLLAVADGLLQGLDDQRAGGRDDGDLCLTVLDGQLHSDTQTLPVLTGFSNVFTDLLGRLMEQRCRLVDCSNTHAVETI